MIESNIAEIARICTALAVQSFFQWATCGARIVRNSVLEETDLTHVVATRSLRFALHLLELRDRAFAGGNDHRRHRYHRHWKRRCKRWFVNRARCRHALAIAVTQIAGTKLHWRKASKPTHILHDHWIVQPVAIFKIRLHLRHTTGVRHLSTLHCQPRADTARCERQQHEHHQRDSEEGRNHECEAS